ncbi:FkbM family methyltransferase [Candidatus Pelagibacter communis]|uniref:FkbM family methyltransferase n=1 Tax=Pelagibacter ubique TaxID=198252 RepID=UPI00094D4493|nr:FkbM family methyltransferase [Candidatus Pelagibacter ubique]
MKKIIYDLGANNGDNISYYLMKSDLVVAVEANPKLCKQITDKFKEEILKGRLVVENFIITVDRDDYEKDFYIHKDADVLSQFPEPKKELINHFIKTKLPSKNLIELIKKYGSPYYIKIDVENYDYKILSEIFKKNIYPNYFSVECYNSEIFHEIVNNKNYNSYKIVCGSNVNQKYKNNVLFLGKDKIKYSFPAHSAGPFGNDIHGKWLSRKNFILLYSLRNTTWIDIHCSKDDIPSKYYLPIDLIIFFKKKFFKKLIILFLIILIMMLILK